MNQPFTASRRSCCLQAGEGICSGRPGIELPRKCENVIFMS